MAAFVSVSTAVAIPRAVAAATTPGSQPARATASTPATLKAVTRPVVVDGAIVKPVAKCEWSDLLTMAMRGGKLEVESRPPPVIANALRNRRQRIDIEIAD